MISNVLQEPVQGNEGSCPSHTRTAVDDHGPFALGGLLSHCEHKLQDALGGVCWRHAVIGPGCVVKMHHVLRFVRIVDPEVSTGPVLLLFLRDHLHGDVPISNGFFCEWPVVVTFYLRQQ